jgi:hypothetical protein
MYAQAPRSTRGRDMVGFGLNFFFSFSSLSRGFLCFSLLFSPVCHSGLMNQQVNCKNLCPLGPASINDKLKHSHRNATAGEDKMTGEENRILLALCLIVKETYKSDRSLPSAMSTLRHVIKRISMRESPNLKSQRKRTEINQITY